MREDVLNIMKDIKSLQKRIDVLENRKIQSGKLDTRERNPQKNTLSTVQGEKKRTAIYKEEISFEPSFETIPEVRVSLSLIDADTPDQNLRIDAFPDNIEKDGFTLKIKTWNRSKIFDCRAEWVAYTT